MSGDETLRAWVLLDAAERPVEVFGDAEAMQPWQAPAGHRIIEMVPAPAPADAGEVTEAQVEVAARAICRKMNDNPDRISGLTGKPAWTSWAGTAGDAIRAASIRAPSPTVPGWQPIETAKKDGTPIWAALHADLSARLGRSDLTRWDGYQVPLRHPGLLADGLDLGWAVAAPVGYGGISDAWIAGWMSLPAAPPRHAGGPPA